MYMRIAIVGYGNLGQGAELALRDCRDCEAVGVFTRRDPAAIRTRTGIPVYPAADILSWEGKLDVLLLCGGSAADLPEVTPALAAHFEVVDSFDNHRDIPAHFARTDAAARAGGHLALIAAGWDPGLFSLLRLYADAVLPDGQTYTFWGAGVSQGHSDAVRRLAGVRDARAYTYPVPEAPAAHRIRHICIAAWCTRWRSRAPTGHVCGRRFCPYRAILRAVIRLSSLFPKRK